MSQKQLLLAKAIIGLLIGLVVGYAVGVSLAKDAAKGRALTMEQYVADFQRHKADLESSAIPMPAAVVIGVLMVFGAFALYEGLSYGLAKGFAAVASPTPSSSFPPAARG